MHMDISKPLRYKTLLDSGSIQKAAAAEHTLTTPKRWQPQRKP